MGSSAETGMGSPIRKQKDFFGDQKKRVRKPLIPIGALLTAGILTVGLIKTYGSSCGCPSSHRCTDVGTAYYCGENLQWDFNFSWDMIML
ncbi:hypothetical protein AMTRI_Chr09g36940 [Amborella trichopoda]